MHFIRIPLIALIGWSCYGEPLDLFVIAGAASIVGAILWNLRRNRGERDAAASSGREDRGSHFGHHWGA